MTSDSTPREGKEDLIYKGWAHAFTADGEIALLTDGTTWCVCWKEDAVKVLADAFLPEENDEEVTYLTVQKKEESNDQR